MLNIIETFQNYFTRELLPYSLSSEVAVFGGKLFAGSVLPASAAPVVVPAWYHSQYWYLVVVIQSVNNYYHRHYNNSNNEIKRFLIQWRH